MALLAVVTLLGVTATTALAQQGRTELRGRAPGSFFVGAVGSAWYR